MPQLPTPYVLACLFLAKFKQDAGGRPLKANLGKPRFYEWNDGFYTIVPKETMRLKVVAFLKSEFGTTRKVTSTVVLEVTKCMGEQC